MPKSLSDLKIAKKPLVIAHRGYRAKYPENTLIAFEAAIDAGADMIELDVLLTKDRKVVVIHDESLDRTTNGQGMVSDHTLLEIKALDAGTWFDARFMGERLPTLEEVLEMVDRRVPINIEIKRSAYEPHHPADAIERQIVELVTRRNAVENVLISSFEWRLLEHLPAAKQAPAVAILSGGASENNPLEACRKLGAFSWHPKSGSLRKEHVREMHETGILVFPWNVYTPDDIGRMLEMDVDGVIVDDPLLIKSVSSLVPCGTSVTHV
jgi:glycerophosphoryl diester phosphodiesterase